MDWEAGHLYLSSFPIHIHPQSLLYPGGFGKSQIASEKISSGERNYQLRVAIASDFQCWYDSQVQHKTGFLFQFPGVAFILFINCSIPVLPEFLDQFSW